MKLESLVKNAREFCGRILQSHKCPGVLWSGGKDSTVMLHILREMGVHLPVVCWREPYMLQKLQYTNELAAAWDLTLFDFPPAAVALSKGMGRIDVMQHYMMGEKAIILARGTEKPEPGKPFLCGKKAWLQRPTAKTEWPWDVMFHGHKNTDVDPCSGGVPLEVDLLQNPGCASMAYPMREWEDDDVFAYADAYKVPLDPNRYYKTVGIWMHNPDKTLNSDYYHTCWKCCDPDEGEFVRCPQLGDAQINNISAQIPWINPRLPYCNLRSGAEAGS